MIASLQIGNLTTYQFSILAIFNFKGQLISKCLFGVIVWTKKNNEFFLRISALAYKKRSNQKNKDTFIFKKIN